jgi:Mat/Ecp fimbriae outer membrane usher protein
MPSVKNNRAKRVVVLLSSSAGWLLALLASGSAFAQADPAPESAPAPPIRIETEDPEGFDDLLEARETPLQLYVDGRSLGQVPVLLAPGTVRFADAGALIAKLPPLKEPARVAAVLRGELPSNAGLSCSPSPTAGCGRLDPEVAGVIVSRDSGRIDLFLAPEVRGEARPYLPDPEPGPPTLAGALGLQYSLNRDRIDFTLQPRFVLGLGRSHIAADATFGSRQSSLDRAYMRRVGNRTALTAGLVQASSYNFVYFDRLVGVQFASSTETRIERGSIADTPLLIDAPLSGRVEILRDGVLLDTQRIAPGRVTLDTAQLPGGAYPLTLRIKDASGEREEVRFFTRAPGLPGYGDAEWFAEGGWNTAFRGQNDGFMPNLLSPTFRAGYRLRAGPQLGLFARGEATEKRQLVELGAVYLLDKWRVSATLAGTAQGEYGAQANVAGNSKGFNWSLDARHIEGKPRLPGTTFDPERGLGRSQTSLSAFGGYSQGKFSFNSGILMRRDEGSGWSYTLLPNLRWTFGQEQGRRWELDTSGSYSRTGWSVRAGIRLSLYGGRSSKTLYSGGEGRNSNGSTRFRPIASADWSNNSETDFGPLQLRAGVSQQYDRLSGRLGANLRHTYANLSADAQIEEQLESSSLYGRAETSFGLAGGRLAFGSSGFSGSGIVVEATDAAPDAKYQLRAPVGGGVAIMGSKPVFVSTSPYSIGDVGVDASGGASAFDTRREPALFFPGTVKRLVRGSTRVVLVYGELVDEGGAPMKQASLEGKAGIAESDGNGRFQIELGADGSFTVEDAAGKLCQVQIEALDTNATLVNAGTQVCKAIKP